MESGSTFVSWSRGRDFKRVATAVAKRFHCSTETSEEMISCLQTKNFRLIDETYLNFFDFNFQPFYFGPRIDGDFIPGEPVTLVKKGQYHHVPVMMGVNRDEGSLVAGEMYWDRLIPKNLAKNFTKNGPAMLELYPDEDPVNTSYAVYDYYLGGLNFEYEDANNVSQLFTDRLFHIPIDWLTKVIGDQDDVYRWELRHRGQHSYLDKFPGLNGTLKEQWICHSDELPYIFHPGSYGFPTTPDDILVSELYTTMWTNFAKTGNPTPNDTLAFTWEKTNSKDLKKLIITADPQLQMEKDTKAEQRAFWESLPLRINEFLKS